MKTLISFGLLRPGMSSSSLPFMYARYLQKEGVTCELLCYVTDKSPVNEITAQGFNLHLIPKYEGGEPARLLSRKIGRSRSAAEKLLHYTAFVLRHPVISFKLWRNRREYPLQARKVLREGEFDSVLCITFPFAECRRVLIMRHRPCPAYVICHDSFGLQNNLSKDNMKKEIKSFYKAEHIFALTPMDEALRKRYPIELACRISPILPPNIMIWQTDDTVNGNAMTNIYKDDEMTRILFSGRLRDEVRNPEYLLRVFMSIPADKVDFHLYFMGHTESAILTEYAQKYPNIITMIREQPRAVANTAINAADILINLGNADKYYYQIPSKIFQYFCTGKPMIGTIKSARCPTLPYLKQYRNCMIMDESISIEENRVALVKFIQTCKNVHVSYKEVEQTFYKGTPKYVAQHIKKTMERGVAKEF